MLLILLRSQYNHRGAFSSAICIVQDNLKTRSSLSVFNFLSMSFVPSQEKVLLTILFLRIQESETVLQIQCILKFWEYNV